MKPEKETPMIELENLQAEAGPEPIGSPAGAPPPESGSGTGDAPPGAEQIPPEDVANQVISMANGFLLSRQLQPLNELQTFLLRVGLVGTIKKHNITLNPENYPEVVLLGVTVWIAIDKAKEVKAKAAAAQSPPPGQPSSSGEPEPAVEQGAV